MSKFAIKVIVKSTEGLSFDGYLGYIPCKDIVEGPPWLKPGIVNCICDSIILYDTKEELLRELPEGFRSSYRKI